MAEAGIDTGGMFKEFLYDMAKNILNPDYGLFKEIQDRELEPNVESSKLVGPEYLTYFYFVGVIVGRAIFDEILIDHVFSKILLRRILSKPNFYSQLRLYDKEIFESLEKIKNYEGNIEDLGLSFVTTDKSSGRDVELIKNGSNVEVTNENKIRYIYYLSHYILNVQNKKQTLAFLTGLEEIVPKYLLKLFTAEELQTIISGQSAEINIDDLRLHTKYEVKKILL